MNNFLYRKDNKKLFIWMFLAFLGLIFTSLIVNVINTKNVFNMYILFLITSISLLLYLFTYPFIVKKYKSPLKLSDNNLAFYISFNPNNKKIKLLMIIIDIIEILFLLLSSFHYLYRINIIEAYNIYPIFVIGFILILNVYILVRDIIKYNSYDRIDAKEGYKLSSIDKKLLFAITLLIMSASNIGMFTVKVPHFVIHYVDMVAYEIIITVLLIISLASVFISKIYYYYFDIKQLEQSEFNEMYLEEIGKGHYGIVYKAYIPSLNTNYALKRLISTDSKDVEKFKTEFEMMKMCNHPNLVKVYSINEIKYEYIMDYCDYSLYDYVLNNKLSFDDKLLLINQLLDAFKYLHSKGIKHRDISYYNIMILRNENEPILKVMDFGNAKSDKIKKTKTGTEIKGTLIDPTLAEYNKYNEQNDIYGLGIIINFIYYQTDSIIADSSKMSNIILKCMDINLINRYHNVSEIINDIKEVNAE